VRQGLRDLSGVGLPDAGPSFARNLPAGLQKVRMQIYDEASVNLGNPDISRLVDRLFESALYYPKVEIRSVRLLQQEKKVYIGNSLGLSGKYRKTVLHLSLVLGFDGEWVKLTDSRVFWQDFDPLSLVTRGVNLLRSFKGGPWKDLKSVPLVFSPESATLMLRLFASRFRLPERRDQQNWREEDEARIFPQLFRLEDEPHLDRQVGSVPFDDEGVQTPLTRLVDRGRIVRRIGDIRRSSLWHLTSTGNGFRVGTAVMPGIHFSNLSIPAGVYAFRRLLADAEGGVLVTMLLPISAQAGQSLLQGFGFRIQGGDMAEPVRFIVKTRFPDFFLRLQKTSKERRFFYQGVNIGSPFLLSEGVFREDGLYV
jgi:predicted Zn-dependent protease